VLERAGSRIAQATGGAGEWGSRNAQPLRSISGVPLVLDAARSGTV
jgi:hypothetical protein